MSENDKSNKASTDVELSALAQKFAWVESPRSVQKLIMGLSGLCLVLFLLDFVVHRHISVSAESTPGFYAGVGFLAFTCIVLGATQLRRLILRSEDYYAPHAVDAEEYPETGLEKKEQ